MPWCCRQRTLKNATVLDFLMSRHTDRIVGGVLLFFGLVMVYLTSRLPPAPFGFSVSSGTYPALLSWALVLLSLLLVARKVRPVLSELRLFSWRAIVGFGLTVVYVVVFRQIGFLVCTMTLLVTYALLLQKGIPKIVDTVIVPLASTAAVYVLLRILNVPLPIAILI